MNLHKISLLQGFSDVQLEKIAKHVKEKTLLPEEFLFREGDSGDSFYFIAQGEIEILKGENVHLAQLHEGDVLGEMAVMGNLKREASARALKECTLVEISLKKIPQNIASKLHFKLSKILMERVKKGNVFAVEVIQEQLEHLQARSRLGNTFIYLLLLIFLYVYTVQILLHFKVHVISSTIISIPILMSFALFMIYLIKNSSDSLKEHGFNLNHWLKNSVKAFLWTIPLLGAILFAKWCLVSFFPKYAHLKVISLNAALNPGAAPPTPFLVVSLILAYLIFVPVQEMIYRGALQVTLEKLLVAKRRGLIAILISNLPFSLIHLHLSVILALIVYFFGLFWGWMFARQRSLVGCTLSHLMTGFWSFFMVGIQEILT